MPGTSFASGDALTVKKWSAALYIEARNASYWARFTGTSTNSIIQVNTELEKDVGDAITFALRMKLSGGGKKNDEKMEGNEEKLIFHNFKTTLYMRQNAVVAEGKMSMRRTKFNIKSNAKQALGFWVGEKVDQDTIKTLSGLANSEVGRSATAPSTNRIWYGGQTTGGTINSVANDAAIDSNTNHLFGTEVISLLKRKAKDSTPKILPILDGGRKLYVCCISNMQAKALTAEAAWKTAQQNANVRGEKNPIFSGALGIWNGVIIHDIDDMETRMAGQVFDTADTIAAGMTVARGLFLGAQAGVHAYGQHPGWYEKNFEYGRIPGVLTDVIMSAEKTRFDGEDFAVIVFDTAYVGD